MDATVSHTQESTFIIADFETAENGLIAKLEAKRQAVLKPIWDNIPEELKALNRFVPWHYVIKRGKVEKEPYLVDVNTPASKTDPNDWLAFDAAKSFVEDNGYEGVWLVLTKDDPYVAIDMDKVVSGKLQKIEPYAKRIVDELDSYTELSPSGTGYRVVVKAAIQRNIKKPKIEMYGTGYISLTGHWSGNRVKPIAERGWQTRDLYAEFAGDDGTRYSNPNFAYAADDGPLTEKDQLRLETIFGSKRGAEIKHLYDGDTAVYGYDRSAADLALCSYLAWWFDYDAASVDRVFRHSRLMREKWDDVHYASGETYGEHSIKLAFGDKKPGDGYGSNRKAEHGTASESTAQGKTRPNIFSAADLMQKEFKPVDFVIPNFLPTGLTMLAAKPKIGKSWLALDMCLQIASGGYVLGETLKEPGDVLYLSLEDSQRRLKERIVKLSQDDAVPPRLELATSWQTLDNGGLNEIAEWITRVDNPRLVVIDTLIKCMPAKKGREEDYAFISRTLAPLQRLALDNDVAILLVHHLRKNTLGGDDFDAVMGSQAHLGIADTTWVLKRNRMELEATLSLTSRDIDEKQVGLTFDKDSCKWCMGDAAMVGLSQAQRHVYEAIGKGFRAPKEIVIKTGILQDTVKKTLQVLVDKGLIHSPKRGVYLKAGAVYWE